MIFKTKRMKKSQRRRRERSERGAERERRKRKGRRKRRRSRVKKRRISGRNVIGGSSGLVLVLVAANLCNAKCSNHQRLLLRAADTAMNNELVVPFYPSHCHSHFLSPSLCHSHFLTFHMIESDLANSLDLKSWMASFCFIS